MNITQLISSVESRLRKFGEVYAGMDLRGKVLLLADILRTTRKLNVQVVKEGGCNAKGSRERIRLYLIQYVEQVIAGKELEVVSGISEYGRRIRELRVEYGYRILSGASNDPEGGIILKPTEYLLLRTDPDRELAHRWRIANRIRRDGSIGGQDKILAFFRENVGHIVTSEELAYVSKVKDFGRRARELRTEEGYLVATRFTGRPDLRSGEYVLESLDRMVQPHDRHISKETQDAVYARDNNTCRNCGWNRDQWTRQDPRFLELHHKEAHAKGGANDEVNLMVLCNVCHDKVHAKQISPPC